jgi:hypothetical protein
MRKFFAVALGSVMALVGFSGAANASATVDLVWIDLSAGTVCLRPAQRNCPQLGSTLSSVLVTDNITLAVILTAGPGGSWGGGVSVDYNDAIPKLGLIAFRRVSTTKPKAYLPNSLGSVDATSNTGWVQNINAAALPTGGQGLGLPANGTAYLGTVTFHKDQLINGTFEIAVGTDGPNGSDGILDGAGGDISSTSTYNSAWVINVPEPGALSLLVMGLGGMLLAGRGRRS